MYFIKILSGSPNIGLCIIRYELTDTLLSEHETLSMSEYNRNDPAYLLSQ